MSEKDILSRRFPLVFEVFPPKTEAGMENLRRDLEKNDCPHPDGICCSYSAGGVDAGKNMEILRCVSVRVQSVPITRFTLAGNTRESALSQLRIFLEQGHDHVLAQEPALVPLIRQEFGSRFTVFASCDTEMDIDTLKKLSDDGADCLVARVCWDMDGFRRWLDRLHAAGLSLPVFAEVLPVVDQAEVISAALSRSSLLPRELSELISKYWIYPNPFVKDSFDAQAGQKRDCFRRDGLEYTIRQIQNYRSCGVSGIHLLTQNRFEDAVRILNSQR